MSGEYQMDAFTENNRIVSPTFPCECNASDKFLKRLILIKVFGLKNEVAIL